MMRICGVLLVLSAISEAGDIRLSLDRYHTHEEMVGFLEDIASTYSNITRLYSIGQSYDGRELWVLRLSGSQDQLLRPHVKLVGNIHGNEAVGREVLLHFIKYLTAEYHSGDRRVRRLLDYAHVHILPSLNPDGFALALNRSAVGSEDSEAAILTHCLSRPGRKNSLGKDLNRNFPDFFRKVRPEPQHETEAVMRWLEDIPFILSASLHGGSLVANYPFDNSKDDIWERFFRTINASELPQQEVAKQWKKWRPDSAPKEPHLTEDDDVFKHLALVYARAHPHMHEGEACPNNYAKDVFPDGITNGAEWYPLTGSMQDYNYLAHGCMEITLEISCCKFPEPSELKTFWSENREPLMAFLEESRRSVRGLVLSEDGAPVANATLRILEREQAPFYSTSRGEFWRILLAGDYILQVEADGFDSKMLPLRVSEPDRAEWALPPPVTVTMRRPGAPGESLTSSSADITTEDTKSLRGRDSSPRTSENSAMALQCSRLLLLLLLLSCWQEFVF